MFRCRDCNTSTDENKCPDCGRVLSVEGDSLDQLIEAGSLPSLATLFQRGKAAGLIKPVQEYGHPVT